MIPLFTKQRRKIFVKGSKLVIIYIVSKISCVQLPHSGDCAASNINQVQYLGIWKLLKQALTLCFVDWFVDLHLFLDNGSTHMLRHQLSKNIGLFLLFNLNFTSKDFTFKPIKPATHGKGNAQQSGMNVILLRKILAVCG